METHECAELGNHGWGKDSLQEGEKWLGVRPGRYVGCGGLCFMSCQGLWTLSHIKGTSCWSLLNWDIIWSDLHLKKKTWTAVRKRRNTDDDGDICFLLNFLCATLPPSIRVIFVATLEGRGLTIPFLEIKETATKYQSWHLSSSLIDSKSCLLTPVSWGLLWKGECEGQGHQLGMQYVG